MALTRAALVFFGILSSSSFLLAVFAQQQNRRGGEGRGGGNAEFAHMCGKFPNRYFSYEPCPEDEQQQQQPPRRDQQPPRRGDQQQQKQQICSRPGWQTIGIRCQNVNDCYQHRENVAMMCERGECCSPVGPAAPVQDGRGASGTNRDTGRVGTGGGGTGGGGGIGRVGTAGGGGGTGRGGGSGRQPTAPPTSAAGGAADTYLWWQTCENGGYFTGQTCRTTPDCRQGYGQDGQRLDQRLARYEQICLQNECCTTNRELDLENGIITNPNTNNQRRPSNPNINPTRPTNPQIPTHPSSSSGANSCETFNGGRLIRNAPHCKRHGDCNRLVGDQYAGLARVGDTQQLACVAQQCCLMTRQLPPGIIDWQQLCPLRQGTFTGMFCHQNDADCDTAVSTSSSSLRRGSSALLSRQQQQQRRPMVCELNRYCCTSTIDRSRRQNQGCDDGDMITGSRCVDDDRDCYRGEYCGDLKICCLPRRRTAPQAPADEQQPTRPSAGGQRIREPLAAYCYNGEQSSVTCEFQADCLDTQSCVDGLCCVRSGNEWKSACGGAMAVSNCFQDRTCHDSLVCTSSDYCCECPYGQTTGKCTHGCPPNFTCSSNGFCCPRCASGAQPYGACFNQRCATGYTCVAGNICCPTTTNEARRSRL